MRDGGQRSRADDHLRRADHALHEDGILHDSRRWFEEAYQEAERSDDSGALARAALGLGGIWLNEHRTTAESVMINSRQEHALAAIRPDSVLAVRLCVRLAAERDNRMGEHAAVMRALVHARTTGDPVALAEALSLAHHCLMSPEHQELRFELAQELVGVASRTRRRGDLLMGLLWWTVDLFLAADPHAERSLRELRERLAVRDHPAIGFVIDAIEVMLLIRAGRFEEAERAAAACSERGTAAGDVNAIGWYGAQLVTIRWYQGRVAELLPLLSDLVNSSALCHADYAYFPALAVAAAEAGDRRLAETMVARLRDITLPPAKNWLAAMYGLVEAAHLLDDEAMAARAYDLLQPYARLPMIASRGVACFGSAHQSLGLAALTMGQVERAAEHFGEALRANRALGHWPAAALSRWRLGHVLVRLGGPRDELVTAEKEAAELGMSLPEVRGTQVRAAGPSVAVCSNGGRWWRVELAGRTALVKSSVGMRHLAVLIANPRREIRAIDLVAGGEDTPSHSAQPLLDEYAERTYVVRMAELEEEIGELEAAHDLERAAVLRSERDWLISELTASTGLGGRARNFTDDHERARVAVAKAIRRALTHIAEADEVIGAELRATVRTGVRCSYLPR
ncbi:hypothetical protein [Nonomuraea soli]|uniref:Tetratricopeptide (TPR) repeat protein n=1 Tax=Nonomuraea soli TaxID=1032476 RepID=A0A7W0CMY0_9ACTN|nr:hypothetical protein [Nonomuraea soli]MBA2893915.1 tetratricopeptide (TPR) repeat protein [Nonomuraea soli]